MKDHGCCSARVDAGVSDRKLGITESLDDLGPDLIAACMDRRPHPCCADVANLGDGRFDDTGNEPAPPRVDGGHAIVPS
jgi:hypothetical protein